jgi:threonine/homoserine/homoserine lactone efflux protein
MNLVTVLQLACAAMLAWIGWTLMTNPRPPVP